MKILGLNGSPRKNGNTAVMLQNALAGAKAAGAETELIHLYDLKFSGCHSCFSCKKLGSKGFGHCAWKDDLSGVLKKTLAADAIFLGSPIYFGDVTAVTRAYLERILFPSCLYSTDGSVAYSKRIPVGMIYTMNRADPEYYDALFEELSRMVGKFLGPVESIISAETLQYNDYSKFASAMFDEAARIRRHEEVFPQECQEAFRLGQKLAGA